MWGLLNTLSAPVKSATNQFLRNQSAAAVRRTGLETLRRARSGPGLTSELAALQLTANVPAVQAGAATFGGLTAADISNRTGFTGQIEGALNQVGPALDRFFSGTPQVIQQFGREQEKKGWGGALEMASPLGFLAAPFIPNTPAAKPSMPGLPANYKQTELAAGAAAERFRPGAGFPGQQAAADRDYESQKRRAEQLAQQDQLSKKYRVADLTKAYNTAATPEEKEKIGLEIWATTNPQLAQKLKPGQLGYEQVQSVQTTQSPFGGALQAAKNIELADKISFDAVPSAGFGVGFGANLNTQIPGVQVPANLQENIAGAFTSPVNVPSFDQAANLFDPAKISEVDRATLIRLFNEGLQKK